MGIRGAALAIALSPMFFLAARPAIVLMLSFLFLGAHCNENGGQKPEPSPADPESCEAACARLAELGCPEAEPTPEGATCTEVCENVEHSGAVTLNPACVVGIDSCDELDPCVEVGAPGAGGAG